MGDTGNRFWDAKIDSNNFVLFGLGLSKSILVSRIDSGRSENFLESLLEELLNINHFISKLILLKENQNMQ